MEPFFHLIRDLLRRADKGVMFMHRAAAGNLHKIPHAWVFLAGEHDHAITKTMPGKPRQFVISEWFIIGLAAQIPIQHFGK